MAEHKTASGIYLAQDTRAIGEIAWGEIVAVGPDVVDINVGEWALMYPRNELEAQPGVYILHMDRIPMISDSPDVGYTHTVPNPLSEDDYKSQTRKTS